MTRTVHTAAGARVGGIADSNILGIRRVPRLAIGQCCALQMYRTGSLPHRSMALRPPRQPRRCPPSDNASTSFSAWRTPARSRLRRSGKGKVTSSLPPQAAIAPNARAVKRCIWSRSFKLIPNLGKPYKESVPYRMYTAMRTQRTSHSRDESESTNAKWLARDRNGHLQNSSRGTVRYFRVPKGSLYECGLDGSALQVCSHTSLYECVPV